MNDASIAVNQSILHIIKDEKFTDGLISNYEQVAPGRSTFLIITQSEDRALQFVKSRGDNLISVHYRNLITHKDLISKAPLIIFHGLDRTRLNLLGALKGSERIVVHFWGAEIYLLPSLTKRLLKPATKRIFNQITPARLKLKERFRGYYYHLQYKKHLKKVNYFSTVIPTEATLIKKYLPEATQIMFNYVHIEGMHLSSKTRSSEANDILIGNSSSYTCNHLDIIHKINDIEALQSMHKIIPLNYGDKRYAAAIIKALTDYGDLNYLPLTDFLPISEYNTVLSRCAIAIMGHQRQQAIGTIIMCLWMGMRVFLSEKNPAFAYYKSEGLYVFSLESDLKTLLRKGINALPNHEAEQNRSILTNLYSEPATLRHIRKIVELINE